MFDRSLGFPPLTCNLILDRRCCLLPRHPPSFFLLLTCRCQALCEAIRADLEPLGCRLEVVPRGGYFAWLTLPPGVATAKALLDVCAKHRLKVAAGPASCPPSAQEAIVRAALDRGQEDEEQAPLRTADEEKEVLAAAHAAAAEAVAAAETTALNPATDKVRLCFARLPALHLIAGVAVLASCLQSLVAEKEGEVTR